MAKHSQSIRIASLKVDTSFVVIGALRAGILILEAYICVQLQAIAVAFSPDQVLDIHQS